MLKKKLLAIAATAAVMTAPVLASANQLQDQINIGANLAAELAAYQGIWHSDPTHSFSSDAGVTAIVNRYAGVIASGSISNTSEAITITYGSGNAVNQGIRGLVMTLTPKTFTEGGASATGFSSRATDAAKRVDTWTCALDNTTVGNAAFMTYVVGGKTANVWAESKVTATGVNGQSLTNIAGQTCANVTVTTSAG
ncbi:MAG: hypothetical protein K0S08_572 [Gammaproteobacteria bacterium]|jgi:hypothetical protein|nr:hypothetical protein [Gammaproteobacteria bacterium]